MTDPQNFGSILRSAMFLGVDAVIVNKLNACGLTPTVSKVSSGALEFTPVHSVKFVSKFFVEAQQRHGYKIISTNLAEDLQDEPQPHGSDEDDTDIYRSFDREDDDYLTVPQQKEQKLIPLDQLRLKRSDNTMLVLGSEGEGVSRTIGRMADYKVVIPPGLQMGNLNKYPYNMVDSLNVGVSAAMLLYHIKHTQ